MQQVNKASRRALRCSPSGSGS